MVANGMLDLHGLTMHLMVMYRTPGDLHTFGDIDSP